MTTLKSLIFLTLMGSTTVANASDLVCEATPHLDGTHSNYGLVYFDEIEGVCQDLETSQRYKVFLGGVGISLRSESFFEFQLSCPDVAKESVSGGYTGTRFHIGLPGLSAAHGQFVSLKNTKNSCSFWGNGGDFGSGFTKGVLILQPMDSQ